jgi:hypothetical protein
MSSKPTDRFSESAPIANERPAGGEVRPKPAPENQQRQLPPIPADIKRFKRVSASLEALGYSLDSIAASGSLPADLDEKMKKRRWTPMQQIALKLNLGIVGAIE